MKIMIYIITILFLSCSLGSSGSNRTDEEIKLDLVDIALVIPVIEAGLQVVNESEVNSYIASRAIDPTKILDTSSTTMEIYFGTNWKTSPNTPSQVFSAKGITGQTLRIPEATGTYINGLYGSVNNDFYLTMTEISGTKYLIDLFIYPRDDFNVTYINLQYYVDDTTTVGWAWTQLDNRGRTGKYSIDKTYYRDGTYSDNISDPEPALTIYADVIADAPAINSGISDLLTNYKKYEYPSSPPNIVTSTTAGGYSSYTSRVVKGTQNRQDVEEYYTEVGNLSYSVFFMEGNKRKDLRRNVTRYITDRSTNKTSILSLNTEGNYYTEMNLVNKTSDTYTSEKHIWYTAPSSSLVVRDATSSYNSLVKDTDYANTHLYKGTLKDYWGISGVEYSYSINAFTGTASMTWLSNLTRSITSSTIDLSKLTEVKITGTNWAFSGAYEMGELFGVYTYHGANTDVVIDLEGIVINNKFYKWK